MASGVHPAVLEMNGSRLGKGRAWRVAHVAVVAMAFLVLAAGLCMFDAHPHGGPDDRAALDLCLVLVASIPIALTSSLPLAGPTGASRPALVHEFSPHVPAPPPKRLS
jgi:hypothetical protein